MRCKLGSEARTTMDFSLSFFLFFLFVLALTAPPTWSSASAQWPLYVLSMGSRWQALLPPCQAPGSELATESWLTALQ